MRRSTHTFVTLSVSRETYQEIEAKLKYANYNHVFVPRPTGTCIDMHGIALVQNNDTPVKRSKSKVLRYLKKIHPEKKWRVTRAGFGWQYETEDGWLAHWVAALAPRYPDDDDNFVSQFWIYKTNGESPEQVYFWFDQFQLKKL